jgi:hypothetical protein
LRTGVVGFGLALGTACVTGGPTSSASVGSSVGSIGEGSGGDSSSSGSQGGTSSTGTSTSDGSSSESGAAPTCVDAMHNGDETDVDCGGACPPCANGGGCVDVEDCASGVCEGGSCCTTSFYEVSTGEVSGSAMVCCEEDDVRLELTPCGTGVNYSTDPVRPNCASTSEGAMNNGTACVSITCQRIECGAGDTSTT